MTLDQLRWLSGILPPASIAVAVLFGLLGIWLVRRTPRRERPDHAWALRSAGVLSALAAGVVLFLGAAFGSAWGGSAGGGIITATPLAIGAAALVFLSGIATYAALARPGVGSIALLGILAGPVLLGGTTMTVLGLLDEARAPLERQALIAEEEQERQAFNDRSSKLHVSARDIRAVVASFHDPATATERTVISSVHLTLVLRADVPIAFFGPDRDGYPEVRLLPAGSSILGEMRGVWPGSTGSNLPVGESAFEVDFAYTADQLAGRTNEPPHGPGAWTIRVNVLTEAGGIVTEAPIQIEAPGPG